MNISVPYQNILDAQIILDQLTNGKVLLSQSTSLIESSKEIQGIENLITDKSVAEINQYKEQLAILKGT